LNLQAAYELDEEQLAEERERLDAELTTIRRHAPAAA
jgi:hypothetical protein